MTFTTRPELRGTFGMVASTHWLASAAGMAALERGGNAFDAAVVAGFVLQVVEPHQNGPAGDLPVVFHSVDEDRVRVLCAQGPAPAGATVDHYRDLGLDLIPGTGLLAAVIPGAFDGWMQLLRDYGTFSVAEAMMPAIDYAARGYPMAPTVSNFIANVAELFERAWPSSAALYLSGGRPPAAGKLFANPKLAETFSRIVAAADAAGGREAGIEAARDAFYRGFVAEAIERFCTGEPVLDSSDRAHRGVLTAQDMAGWQASYEEPLHADYGEWRVFKTGPWGQGPGFLQQLRLLEGFDISAMDPEGPDFVHTLVECAKLAYADREAYYGDPAFTDVPMDELLSDGYADARRKLVGAEASMALRPGHAGDGPRLPSTTVTAEARGPGVGEPGALAAAGEVRRDTVHVDVVDRWGNMVSAMPSGGWLQSSPVIPELGFPLGTRAQMFWLEEGLPATLAPGKRPRTTLTPGIAYRGGEPYMAFGSPGGDGQDQWAMQFFLHHAHGMDLQAAIDAPSFLSHHWPNSFYPRVARPGEIEVEGRFAPETVATLRAWGHKVEVVGDWSLGRLAAAAREPDGVLKAAANPRNMQGYAVGR